MTPEGKVKEKVKQIFKRYGVHYHMPVQNGMGEPTLDFRATPAGFTLMVETKAPGEKPTERQILTMRAEEDAGAFVFVVSNDEELAILEGYVALLAAVPRPTRRNNPLGSDRYEAKITTRNKRGA